MPGSNPSGHRPTLDLNADVGEAAGSAGRAHDRRLTAFLSSVNIACGGRTTLNQLYEFIAEGLTSIGGKFAASGEKKPVYKDFRAGDVRHSHADVSLANKTVGYEVRYNVRAGLAKSIQWYAENLGASD